MIAVDSNIPGLFGEETATYSGNKTRSTRSDSGMTRKRKRAEKTILKLAQDSGVPVGQAVTRVLIASTPQLRRYVLSRKETPKANAIQLAVQAALLRAEEIGTIAGAIDTTDNDALEQIEGAETDAIDTNNPDAKDILTPDVQAALKLTLDHIKTKHITTGGSGRLTDFIKQVKRLTMSDGFDLNTSILLGVPDHEPIGSKSPGGSVSNNWGILPYDEANTTSETQAVSSGSDFFSIFDKIVTGVTTVVGAIKGGVTETKTSIEDLLGGVKDTASDIGAESIDKAIQKYIPMLLAILIGIILIIVIAVYANKRK
jgi:hypothetical protein